MLRIMGMIQLSSSYLFDKTREVKKCTNRQIDSPRQYSRSELDNLYDVTWKRVKSVGLMTSWM